MKKYIALFMSIFVVILILQIVSTFLFVRDIEIVFGNHAIIQAIIFRIIISFVFSSIILTLWVYNHFLFTTYRLRIIVDIISLIVWLLLAFLALLFILDIFNMSHPLGQKSSMAWLFLFYPITVFPILIINFIFYKVAKFF